MILQTSKINQWHNCFKNKKQNETWLYISHIRFDNCVVPGNRVLQAIICIATKCYIFSLLITLASAPCHQKATKQLGSVFRGEVTNGRLLSLTSQLVLCPRRRKLRYLSFLCNPYPLLLPLSTCLAGEIQGLFLSEYESMRFRHGSFRSNPALITLGTLEGDEWPYRALQDRLRQNWAVS